MLIENTVPLEVQDNALKINVPTDLKHLESGLLQQMHFLID